MKNTILLGLVLLLNACTFPPHNPYAKALDIRYRSVLDETCLPLLKPTQHEEVLPCVLVPPAYPYRAFDESIEGHVKMMFDIDTRGKPINIKVVESVPQGVFDFVALRALKRWTFKALKQNGELLVQPDQFYTLAFDMATFTPSPK